MKRTLFVALMLTTVTLAQPTIRRATNLQALIAHPAFYHLRPVMIVGKVELKDNGELRLSTDSVSIRLIASGPAPEGIDEVRGELWDIGRFGRDDPRLGPLDVKTTFKIDPDVAWPKPGQVTAFVASGVTAATQPPAPSIRNIVLFPSRYLDQKVTLIGQFGGRNLLGDLPEAPGQSRYDFVLRSADAAIWVTNMRPKGKDFELAVDARIDTKRWLEVTGTLQQGRGLQWLDGQGGSIRLAQAPREAPEEVTVHVPMSPPPEVVFSAPTRDETDVSLSTRIRIQFSRDMDPASLRGRVRMSYVDADPARAANEPTAAGAIAFTTQYQPGNRVLEIKVTNPLEGFRGVKVELLEGIAGMDKQALKPFTLTFETGAQ